MSDESPERNGDETIVNPFASGKSSSGVVVVDPAAIGPGSHDGEDSGSPSGAGSDTSGTAKRRGRKPGSKNGSKATPQNKQDISGLESILFSVHLALGAISKTPELALDQTEARELAKAASYVQSYYETSLDPKLMAWTQLLIVAGGIYTPRVIAISMRVKREKMERRKGNVVQGPFGNPSHAPTG